VRFNDRYGRFWGREIGEVEVWVLPADANHGHVRRVAACHKTREVARHKNEDVKVAAVVRDDGTWHNRSSI
jgi:hypothetical protein